MGQLDLPVVVLEQIGHGPVQDADRARGEPRRVLAALDAEPTRLDPDHLDLLVLEERREHADRVAPPAHARDEVVREPAFGLEDLLARLPADHGLEVPDHHRIRVRAQDRAEDVVRGADVGRPVPHGLADGVLQRAAPGVDGRHGRPEQAHPEDIQSLALHVLRAHVHFALQAEQRRHRGHSHAVLARAGLGDDPLLPHPAGQERLADRVVDLVRAGVAEVLALEVDPRPAELLRQPFRIVERRRAPDILPEVGVQLGLELRVAARLLVLTGKLIEGGNQGLGDVPSAEGAEAATRIRKLHHRGQYRLRGASNQSAIIATTIAGGGITTSNSWRWR